MANIYQNADMALADSSLLSMSSFSETIFSIISVIIPLYLSRSLLRAHVLCTKLAIAFIL